MMPVELTNMTDMSRLTCSDKDCAVPTVVGPNMTVVLQHSPFLSPFLAAGIHIGQGFFKLR